MNVFSTRFRQIRESLGLKQTEFAQKLGIPRTSSINYEKGTSVPSEILNLLVDNFSINVEWFLFGKGDMFFNREDNSLNDTQKTGTKRLTIYSASELPEGSFVVPLLDQRLSAGGGSNLPEVDKVTALVRVPAYLSHYGDQIAALIVDGDSMYPTLNRGDMVVCDSSGWSGEGIYALRMGGEGFVKRLTKRPGKIVIISDNPKYPPQEEAEDSQDIQIIGRVHCAITKVE